MSSGEEPTEDMNGESFQKGKLTLKDRSKVMANLYIFAGSESYLCLCLPLVFMSWVCLVSVDRGSNQGDAVETSGSDEGDSVQTGR